jgi:hypothetical protein
LNVGGTDGVPVVGTFVGVAVVGSTVGLAVGTSVGVEDVGILVGALEVGALVGAAAWLKPSRQTATSNHNNTLIFFVLDNFQKKSHELGERELELELKKE